MFRGSRRRVVTRRAVTKGIGAAVGAVLGFGLAFGVVLISVDQLWDPGDLTAVLERGIYGALVALLGGVIGTVVGAWLVVRNEPPDTPGGR